MEGKVEVNRSEKKELSYELDIREGTHFTVVTDHWSLCRLNNLEDPTGRLDRWSLKLQQYSFDLVHRKGKENVVPDMLSRTVPIIDALDVAVNVDFGKSDKWYDRMLYDVDSIPYVLQFSVFLIPNSIMIFLRNSTAKLVCTAVEDHLFLMFGPPKFLLSDNGSQFRSKEFKNLLANYAVKQIFTANYHAQANPTERVNKTSETMIRCYVSENHEEWDNMLSKVACAIRTPVHESMGRTPYFVFFGREFPMNLEIGVPNSSGDFTVDQEILEHDRSEPLQQLHEEVKGKLLQAAEKNKRYYDLRHRDVKYEVGDAVFRKNFVQSDAAESFSSKLANKFVGRFIVPEKVSPWVYELKDPDGRFRGRWHAKDLKPGPE
ncbi:hypothetical protein JTB14_027119 [Gonioctena quinquepunctata]|nr:hypothetical protein JTB14_027119 [Gonioctena quinquepunctata]